MPDMELVPRVDLWVPTVERLRTMLRLQLDNSNSNKELQVEAMLTRVLTTVHWPDITLLYRCVPSSSNNRASKLEHLKDSRLCSRR